MRHVRCLSQCQFYPDATVSIPVNISFTRAFLGDNFKGLRRRCVMAKLNQESPNNSSPKNFSKVSKDAIPKKEVGSSLTKTLPEPVCKHIVFSDSELNPSDTMPATSIKTVHLPKHRTGVNTLPNGMSRNYLSSVSYTLRNLLNKSSSESESSSTDSAHEYTTQNPVPMNNSSRQITKQLTSADVPTENSIGSNLVADSDINNWNEMFDEMQRLGFPTTFGRPQNNRHEVSKYVRPIDLSSDFYEDDEDDQADQWLLFFASRLENNPALRNKTTMLRSLSDIDIESLGKCTGSFPSGSVELKSIVDPCICASSTFSRMCYLFELACIYTDYDRITSNNSCGAFSEWKLNLPRCWDSPTFKLKALLYKCRFFWRYNPPMPKKPISCKTMSSTDFDPSMEKYWAQRYRLFSRFDYGVEFDSDALFSATPEVIAAHQAKRIYRALSTSSFVNGSCTVLDIFCGTGSNAIQLAQRGFRVVAVECDPIRIAMATHNAEIYGVGHLIEFVCDDYFTWAWKEIHSRSTAVQSQSPKKTEYMAAFMSPPWGGPSYLDLDSFELSNIKFQNSDTDFWSALYLALVLANGNAAVYLPRNTNIANFVKISTKCVKELRTDPLNIEFELDLINSKAKALTVYFGALANCNQLTVVPSESSDSSESDYSE